MPSFQSSKEVTSIERFLDDVFITVDRQPGSRSGQQCFPESEVSELGLVWLTRLLGRLDPMERARIERHVFVPLAVIAHPHSRPIGWLLPHVPDGPSRTVAEIRTGQGERIRDALVIAKQLADLCDSLERHGIVDVSLSASRIIVEPGSPPTARVFLGPSTRVDGVPLLLDPPTPAMSDRLGLAHLVDLLLPPAIRDHPTLRDLKTLASCWQEHQLSLAPALWSTALGDALSALGTAPLEVLAPAAIVVAAPVEVPAPPETSNLPPPPAPPTPMAPIAPAQNDASLETPALTRVSEFSLDAADPAVPASLDSDEAADLRLPEIILPEPGADPVIDLLVRQEHTIGGRAAEQNGDRTLAPLRAGLVGLDLDTLSAPRRLEVFALVVVAVAIIALMVSTLSGI